MSSVPTLEIKNLQTHFFTSAGVVKAVDGVSLSVNKGEILGLVGESGSGKTITGFSVLGLIDEPGKIVGGEILFNGRNITNLPEKEMRKLRGKKIAMIFQDPMMTLNPVLRIDTQMMEAVLVHDKVSKQVAWERARDALGMVGIPSPEERLRAYPHQFSGGMRQRVAIATALLHQPDLIVADEPTTALDVTIQAQILSEVQTLCSKFGTAMIWVTHDLAVISGLADKISVMYAGKSVEQGNIDEVISNPAHPYTRGLIGSVPSHNKRGEPLFQIPGMTPSLLNLPKGCSFAPRCERASEQCQSQPPMSEITSGHLHRCFHPYSAKDARVV